MKLQINSDNLSPFAGISFINYEFENIGISQLIDNELG